MLCDREGPRGSDTHGHTLLQRSYGPYGGRNDWQAPALGSRGKISFQHIVVETGVAESRADTFNPELKLIDPALDPREKPLEE